MNGVGALLAGHFGSDRNPLGGRGLRMIRIEGPDDLAHAAQYQRIVRGSI